jgi:hypothetical protein
VKRWNTLDKISRAILRLFRQIKPPTRAWKRLSAYYAGVLSQWALRLQNSLFLSFQMEHIAYPFRDFHGHWVWFWPKDTCQNFIYVKFYFFDIDFLKGRETKKDEPKMQLFSINSDFFCLETQISDIMYRKWNVPRQICVKIHHFDMCLFVKFSGVSIF